MLNKAIIQGRLVADPEFKTTVTGTPVCSFRVACDRDYKSNAEGAQNCDFINIVAWRKTAEFISNHFTKGSQILVDGRIQVRNYTDKNGNKRQAVEVVADSVNFCGKREQQTQQYGEQQTQQYGQMPAEFMEIDDDEGEIPF